MKLIIYIKLLIYSIKNLFYNVIIIQNTKISKYIFLQNFNFFYLVFYYNIIEYILLISSIEILKLILISSLKCCYVQKVNLLPTKCKRLWKMLIKVYHYYILCQFIIIKWNADFICTNIY